MYPFSQFYPFDNDHNVDHALHDNYDNDNEDNDDSDIIWYDMVLGRKMTTMTVMTNMMLQVGGIFQANFADDQNNAHRWQQRQW